MPSPLAPEVVAEIDLTLEHFNANHADTVLLLARFAAGCEAASDAEALGVDSHGLDIEVRVGDRLTTTRLHFDGSVATAAEVSAQVMSRIGVARANAGTRMPITSMEEEVATTTGLLTHPATVTATRDLTPNLREIVVEGAFDGFVSKGQDQFVYVFVGRDGNLPDGYSMARFMQEDPAVRPLGAYYTVRTWEPDAGRMTLWFVTHGHDEGVGGWAGRAQVGDRLAMWGPRPSFDAPPTATTHLFVTDESGFAAVAVRIEELPDDVDAIVIAETIDESHTVALAPAGRADIRWIFRGQDAPGTGTRLLDAVRSLDQVHDQAPDHARDHGGLVAFGAAESRQISAVRRYLRRDRGFAADHVSMTGYWRRATP